MASFFITSCGGDCGGDTCSTYLICEEGYWCVTSGMPNLPEDAWAEQACMRGACVNEEGSISRSCARCDPGYAIASWKDDYKASISSEDCVFVQASCPMYCIINEETEMGPECTNRESCPACNQSTEPVILNCSDSAGISYTLETIREPSCSNEGSFCPNYEYCHPKGPVHGQDIKKCCSCKNNPFICPDPCAGFVCVDSACPPGTKCRSADGGCPVCLESVSNDNTDGGTN